MKINKNTSNNDFIAEEEIISDEPSNLLKNGMSFVAKKALSHSKKIVNKILSNYRPAITINYFTKKEDITSIIEYSLLNKSTDKIVLRDIALNNINTIELAKKLNDEIVKEYNDSVNGFKILLNKNQKAESNLQESEAFQQAINKIKKIKSQFDEKSQFRMKYDFLKELKDDPNNHLTLTSKFNSLSQNYPNWDNPVIAEYLVKSIPVSSLDKKIVFMLLSYYPTDLNYLKLAEKISRKEDSVIFSELIKLFS